MKRKKRRVSLGEFCRNLYRESFDFIKESRTQIFLVISVFVFFVIVGFFVPAPPEIQQRFIELINSLLEKTQGMNAGQLISFIFFNNLQSSFIGMIFGIFLGIFSVFVSVTNGYILGFVAAKAVEVEGVITLWRLLPHGIFELPAVFISLGIGVKLGTFIFKKEKGKALIKYIRKALIVFVTVVLPLLIIAAVVEGSLLFLGR